ncbi:MAG: diguanylate cyclase [Sphaerochaeta sp.]|uniref:GGDEF domain-containing protein n=1 Tax=Sphaerochaeta sp. TaxID=1972642 RepID=UPI002FC909F3
MNATIELDLFSVVLMIFAIALAQRNVQTNPRNRWYLLSALSLLILMGTELFAYTVDDVGVSWQIAYHRLTNVLGFSLSPLVCLFLLYFIGYAHFKRFNLLLLLPIACNTLLSTLSYWNGWMFFVDAENIYQRGPLFLVTSTITLFYYGLCIVHLINTLKRYEASDRPLLICILITPIVGFVLQVLFPWVLTLWPSIALSLLLFYLFFLEQRYSIDTLTGLRNRSIFMRDLLDLQHGSDQAATVVVLDLNYLKQANDTYGHKAGDELLVLASSLIERSFGGLGKVYRVGGDEFAVICPKDQGEAAQTALCALAEHQNLANKSRRSPLSLAAGWAWCESCIDNLFNTYVAADNAMYRNKELMKKQVEHG